MSGAAITRVLYRLQGIKPLPSGGWMARCPAHDDQHQSLKVDERHDGSVLLHCHAGCVKSALLAAMGLSYADLFVDKDPAAKQILATYDYRALDGTLLYQAVRFFPKEFRQRRPDGQGGWIWDMAPLKGKHVAYRLPDLKGQTVAVVCEGEKDADRLWSLGIPATTNIGGAKKWGAGETKSLVAAGVHRVFIIPDNDEAGQAHAQVVGQSVRAANIAVTLLPLPDLPPHGDVSDWLLNGGSKEALQALMAAKPYALPTGQTPAPVAPPALPTDAQTVTQYHLTDLGMAESLRDRYADRLRYDHQREQWLIWDGHFWRPDPDEGAFRTAYDHVRLFQRDATFVPDFLERKKYLDFGLAREKRGPLVAMLQQAAALKPLAVAGDDWDADPMLLGCPNGVVDLRTGTRRDGTREDRITLQAGVPYEHAECPRWWQFLSEVFEGDVELIDYLWRAIGYSLTGDMREQCFFVAYGAGSNGKSLLLDTLETVFGTYGHRADMRMFAGTGQESNSFANADFRGKRLIFAAEVRPNSRMNEHVIKHLTGGESLRAEYKYGRSFTIRPVGKIWLGVNHRPKVTDDSFGFWRRVRLIPFLRTFTGAAEDRRLRDKLRAEAPGILAWAIQGCLEWQARGLVVPAVVQEATQEYRQGEDPLADFFASRVVTGPEATDAVVLVPTLYAAYREWATVQGIGDREKISARSFGALLRARGFEKVSMGGVMAFRGLTLEPKP